MRTITECRSCASNKLEEFLDLGEQYLSDFREDRERPPKCPLVAVICQDCMLVQLTHTASSGDMYHENYGFKSGVSNSIKDDLKDVVSTALEYKEDIKDWLDIASNDGTLLGFVPESIYRVGVDPIEKYCKEALKNADEIVVGFFDANLMNRNFDVITSISCFYDMDEPNKFVADVKEVLNPKGIWIIQQNYLLPTLQLRAVDNFCAEHLEYYTLLSLEPLLERHGLEVIDLSTSMINGGSLRTVVARRGLYPVADIVQQQRDIEEHFMLHEMTPYTKFAENVMEIIKDLKSLVGEINKAGNTIYYLAASTRGSTIWQTAGFSPTDIPCAVERNPEKVGKMFSALNVPIISEEKARENKPDYMLVGPWFFIDEIIDREAEYLNSGGHLITPLPEVNII